MNPFFTCQNGRNISWRSVCDGDNQCTDGSDEEHCHCQGDIYACLQGKNVSCRLACAMYGRVTCLTYQNKRACEQYRRNSTSETTIFIKDFDAIQYSICLSMGILLIFSILTMLVYLIWKKPLHCSSSCYNTSFSSNLIQKSYPRSLSLDLPPSYYYYCYYSDEHALSINDSYEPPPYPGSPSSSSSVYLSDSIYYETISMRSFESNEFPNIRTQIV